MYEAVESDSVADIANNMVADEQNSDGFMYETIEGEKKSNPIYNVR